MRGVGVYSVGEPESQIWALNKGVVVVCYEYYGITSFFFLEMHLTIPPHFYIYGERLATFRGIYVFKTIIMGPEIFSSEYNQLFIIKRVRRHSLKKVYTSSLLL